MTFPLLFSKTSASFRHGLQSLFQFFKREVWPKIIYDIQLSVRQLPQQKVANSIFASSSDHHIDR